MASALDRAKDTRYRLEKCWDNDIDWDLYPSYLKDGCFQIGKALSMSPSAVLGGLVSVTSFILAPAVVSIPGVDWVEPAIVWLSINMPTGSGKSSLHKYLYELTCNIRSERGCKSTDPSWFIGDSTFEKMGELMWKNNGCLFGLYDELSTFLAQINLYRGKGLAVSHELALFLQLYNGSSWSRKTVGGEANFCMDETNLVVGGFSQPSVSRALIEYQGNTEKGFSQRFLWLFPKPSYAKFESLEPVDEEFTRQLVALLACKGSSTTTKLKFQVSYSSVAFQTKYDELQSQLHLLAARDDLLTGMLSKSKGQILRVAACLQTLFGVQADSVQQALSATAEVIHISEDAINASINFVEVCLQHTAFMAGRACIKEEIGLLTAGPCEVTSDESMVDSAAAHTLKLPGNRLFLTPLLKAKKYRKYGYKEGALRAFRELQTLELGKLEELGAEKGTCSQYVFSKAPIPEERVEFAKKLSKYGISLKAYKEALEMPNITSLPKQGDSTPLRSISTAERKRLIPTSPPASPPKRFAESSTADNTL